MSTEPSFNLANLNLHGSCTFLYTSKQMERRSPLPRKYKRFYALLRREQRSLFPTNHCVFCTYIVPLAMGRSRCPTYREEILLGFTAPRSIRPTCCQMSTRPSYMRRDKSQYPIPVGRTSPDLSRILASRDLINRDFQLAGTTKPQRGDRYIEHR